MIIGFLGKGGSGKSTTSAAFCDFVLSQNKKVLAIDADHNMDLLFNLKVQEKPNWLGDSMPDLLNFGGLSEKESNYRDFFDISPKPVFKLSPIDKFTEKYTKLARKNLWVMAGGPHTNQVLHDKACSHVLTTPLKVILPFFHLNQDEFIVIDEKAGSDGAGTGVSSGLDLGVIVLDPSPHGVKAACQIADLLVFFGTPYCFIVNKVASEEVLERVKNMLPKSPIMTLPFNDAVGWGSDESDSEADSSAKWNFSPVIEYADSLNILDDSGETYRYRRSHDRIVRNREFAA